MRATTTWKELDTSQQELDNAYAASLEAAKAFFEAIKGGNDWGIYPHFEDENFPVVDIMFKDGDTEEQLCMVDFGGGTIQILPGDWLNVCNYIDNAEKWYKSLVPCFRLMRIAEEMKLGDYVELLSEREGCFLEVCGVLYEPVSDNSFTREDGPLKLELTLSECATWFAKYQLQ